MPDSNIPEPKQPSETPKKKMQIRKKMKRGKGKIRKADPAEAAVIASVLPSAPAVPAAPPRPRKPKIDRPTYSRSEMKRLLEAVLFAADKPVPIAELGRILDGADETQVRGALADLTQEYESWGRSFLIKEVAGGVLFHTHPAFEPWVKKLFRGRLTLRLSRSALESLAIIAYRQPIGKQEIETIRGVNADGVLHTLLERRLIKVVGRKEGAGRALLYGSTTEFLQYMGLNDLGDLPQIEEMKAILGAQEGPTQPPESGPLGPFAMGMAAEAAAENVPLPVPAAPEAPAEIVVDETPGDTPAPAEPDTGTGPAEPKEYDGGDSTPDPDDDDDDEDDDEDDEDEEDDDEDDDKDE